MTTAAIPVEREASRWLYVWIALVCVLIAIGGFWPTYWGPLAAGKFVEGAPVLHVHGLLFTAWPLLFLAQTWLAATGRIEWHRSLGLLGVAIASAMLFVGLWTTVYSIHVQTAASDAFQARSFAIISVSKLVFFVVFVALAVANVTRTEVHKRLMVVATLSLVQPALGRVLFALFAPEGSPQRPGLGPPPPDLAGLPGSLVIDLILIAIIAYDWRARGRPHPVYLIGGAALVAMQILRVPFGKTPAWHAFVDWLVAIAA